MAKFFVLLEVEAISKEDASGKIETAMKLNNKHPSKSHIFYEVKQIEPKKKPELPLWLLG